MPTLTTPPTLPPYPPYPGVGGGSLINNSECLASAAKLLNMPSGWDVIERGRLKEEYRRNEVRAELLWKGPDNLSARQAFKAWMLGYSRTNQLPGQAAPTLSRTPPASYPGVPYLYASAVTFEQGDGTTKYDPSAAPLDANGNPLVDGNGNPFPSQLPVFYDTSTGSDALSARAKVEYSHLPYNVLSDAELAAIQGSTATTPELDRWTQLVVRPSVQAIPLPLGSVVFTQGGQSLGPNHPGQAVPGQISGKSIPDNASYRLEPLNEILITWYAIDWFPLQVLATLVGKTNSQPFGGAKAWGIPPWAPQSLLMQPLHSIERYRDSRGRVMFDATFRALYRNIGAWNALPAFDGESYPISYANGGAPLFALADFNTLFQAVLQNF